MTAAAFARSLAEAEERLRAAGLTGADAFRALRDTLLHRVGRDGEPHDALVDLALPAADLDLLGLAYERFFPDLFKGRLGQFFTPRSVVRLLLARLPDLAGLDVLDPTCGSGGLLVLAGRAGARVRGLDVDPRMADLAGVNLALAGVDGEVRRADFFAAEPEPADVVVANPPFSVPLRDRAVLDRYAFGQGAERVASDVLFLEALEGWVKPGGHAALVLPWTVVANGSMAAVRDRVDAHWCRRGLCALPEGVFRPFGGAAGRAALLWLQRRPAEDGFMEWAELEDPGYDTRSTRLTPTDDAEVEALAAGRGWRPVAGWLPPTVVAEGPALASWVTSDTTTTAGGPGQVTIDLADTDRSTGEVRPRTVDNHGRRAVLRGGQVLVARMRPELGNVCLVPEGLEAVGSPEWIRLEAPWPHYLLHALRAPSWRASLPPTTGQTRPRTDADTVLATRVPRPSEPVLAEVEALSAHLLREREALRARLAALEHAVHAFVAGGPEAELAEAVARLSEG
ncbi:MAG: N-6 DNA methylase [Alphaproteobacteria bacterium]|nr:N-6 DNA methylase [Alphaproteobacteria bacterium]